jgi:hypothetical protein
MAARNAQKRGAETREAQQRRAPGTRNRGKLDVPPDIIAAEKKKGFGVRWVAMSVHNQPLDGNVESRLMNGWSPVKADEYPKLLPPITLPGRDTPTIIQRGAQILCRKLLTEVEDDAESLRQENMRDLQSVNWNERDNDQKALGAREVLKNDVRIERVTSKSNAGFKE